MYLTAPLLALWSAKDLKSSTWNFTSILYALAGAVCLAILLRSGSLSKRLARSVIFFFSSFLFIAFLRSMVMLFRKAAEEEAGLLVGPLGLLCLVPAILGAWGTWLAVHSE